MQNVETRSFPRAGLLGNPSDGYFGKTLSFAFADYGVELRLQESDRLRFVPGIVDDATFASPEDLLRDVRLYGYYGGIRLLKAVSKRFFEYCQDGGIELPKRNFTAEYKINIPRLVGLSGSSAICSAMLKALVKFYGADRIPIEMLPTLCLEAERELGINCGFQDRVIQIYDGLVFMDFDRAYLDTHGFGRYEQLMPNAMARERILKRMHLYIAFDGNRAEESGKAHASVKRRFEEKNVDVLAAMSEFADIARRGRDLIVSMPSDFEAEFAGLVNANFDLRDRIFNVAPENRRMVETARSVGASAKFAGSGGAIVGTYGDESQYAELVRALSEIGSTTFKPRLALTEDESNGFSTANWRSS